MNENVAYNKELYYRLVAFWVVCEAFAGGIMHATNFPFAGMIVSALAVTSVILIAYYIPEKSAILRATVIVAIFKLMLSPQSPPPAYIAVFFQGLLGWLLFYNKKYFRFSAIVLAVLASVESAVQKILVVALIYGNNFWHAVDQFVQKIAGGKDQHYSMLIAEGYVVLHALTGIFVGIYAAELAKKASAWGVAHPELLLPANEAIVDEAGLKRKKKKLKSLFIVLWLILLILFVQAYFYPKHALLPLNDVLRIFLRAILIIAGWWLIVSPLVMRFMKARLSAYQKSNKLPIREIMQLLPGTRNLFTQARKRSSSEKGFRRFKLFLKILLVNILSEKG